MDGRDKPIISCLEYIREYIMKKIVTVQKSIAKCEGLLTPTAQSIMDKVKEEATKCRSIFNGNDKYQVSTEFGEQFVVDMKIKECTCRRWELTGIPCKHAVAALWDKAAYGERVPHPEEMVHPCYRLETWKRMYQYTIEPINGPDLWPKSGCPTTLMHPKHHPQVGRPRMKRMRGPDESNSQGTQRKRGVFKLSKKYVTVACSLCHNPGHNSRSCKGQGDKGKGVNQM